MTYAKKTLSEIKLIHGNYGNFIKGQKVKKIPGTNSVSGGTKKQMNSVNQNISSF